MLIAKDDLMRSAQAFAEICDGQVEDPSKIIECILSSRSDILRSLAGVDVQLHMVAGARWAVDAFPQIVLGAKYASALCATSVPTDVLDHVKPPWNGWCIEMPSDVIVYLGLVAPVSVRRILITQTERGWCWLAYGSDGSCLFRFGVTTQELSSEDIADTNPEYHSLFPGTMTNQDDRAAALVGRLICGVCLAMLDSGNIKRQPNGSAPSWRRRGSGAPPPAARTYVLGATIELDVRPAIQAYLQGHRNAPPSVQHLVRGHWKPRLAARVGHPVWVAPYWRGPEGAPVLVRSHVISKP